MVIKVFYLSQTKGFSLKYSDVPCDVTCFVGLWSRKTVFAGCEKRGYKQENNKCQCFLLLLFFLFFIFFINTTKEHYLQCHIYITYIKILEWNTLHITLLALQYLHQSVTHTDWHTHIIHSFPFEALHFVSKWKVTFLHISSDNYPRKLRDVIFSLVVFSTP